MKNFVKENWKPLLIIIIATLIGYWGVWNGFFQQDEWAGLGRFYSMHNLSFAGKLSSLYGTIFEVRLAHFLPFLPLFNLLRYTAFETHYEYYAICSLATHLTNSVLVYVLIYKLSREKYASLIGSVLFGIASGGSQAVVWVGTSIPTQLAATFSILSLITWHHWLETESKKAIVITTLSVLLAIGFKETALFLFPAFFLMLIFLRSKEKRKTPLRVLLVGGIVYALVRAALAGFSKLFALAVEGLPKLLIIEARGIVQSVFPQEIILQVADWAIKRLQVGPIPHTPEYDVFLQHTVVATFVITLAVVLFLIYLYLCKKDKRSRQFTFFTIVLVASFIPMIFIPDRELEAVFLSPRNIYIPMIGASGIIGLIFAKIREVKLVHLKQIGIAAFAVYFSLQFYQLRRQIVSFNEVGQTRKTILNRLKSEHPDLANETVFLITSDTSYYGLPGDIKIVPFQSGFGQTLLTWYAPTEKWPTEFLNDKFLWTLESQGFMRVQDRGVGYYREFADLAEAIDKYDIPIDSVIAYEWSNIHSFRDVSEEVQEKLIYEKINK